VTIRKVENLDQFVEATVPRLPAEFLTINQDRIEQYIRRSDALMVRSSKVLVSGGQRIRQAFFDFYKEASAVAATLDPLRTSALPLLMQPIAEDLSILSRVVHGETVDAMKTHLDLVVDNQSDFFTTFVSSGTGQLRSIFGNATELLDIASSYSADLIGLAQGGLTGRILNRVNNVVKLAALGAGPDEFTSVSLINQALGGPLEWSYQAERIFMTETMRLHSMAMQVAGEEADRFVKTDKIWRWSGISRKEHARISGQRVDVRGKFRVPLREGGIVRMRFPRDPGVARYPSAVINCGCSMNFLPTQRNAAVAA